MECIGGDMNLVPTGDMCMKKKEKMGLWMRGRDSWHVDPRGTGLFRILRECPLVKWRVVSDESEKHALDH